MKVLVGLVLLGLSVNSVIGTVTWSYDTPDDWVSLNANCGGQKQSPIDIVKKDAKTRSSKIKIDRIHRNPSSLLYANYANHIAIFFNYRNGGRPVISGGPLGSQEYVFLHAEFHWKGSEHTFDGVRYAAEWQLIWQKKGYIGTGGDPTDKYAVLAYLCNHETSQPREKVRDVIGTTMNIMEDSQSWLERDAVFDLSHLLGSRDEYPGTVYAYEGSFTSPDCSENVKWMVADSPLQINSAELNFLKQIKNAAGETDKPNYRPTQPLNGRVVTKH